MFVFAISTLVFVPSPVYWVPRLAFPRTKWLYCISDYSLSPVAKVMNKWMYTYNGVHRTTLIYVG